MTPAIIEKPDYTLIVPPGIQSMATGVTFARLFPSTPGLVRLYYEDGNTEQATLTAEQVAKGRDNFFSLVGDVQDTARQAPKES